MEQKLAERYLPLYRKYRPQTFYDLIGQENIVKALSNAINLSKISHAYLLCGPRGTGKTSSARILAKSLNCLEGPTLKPCGKCPSCVDIMNSNPIDVIEIDAASNRKVEDARNILEKIQFVPVHGKFKIYIIDEVHMLTSEAFNTLLKTLEEPPENVIFILATTEPHKVLETIISRCQRFDFRRITTDDIVSRLRFISDEEKINISDDALYTIARSSAGGMRDSLALLDQISVVDVDKEITPDDINEMLGRLSFDTLLELSNCILNADTQNAILLLEKIYNKGNEPFQIISNLIQYFRNLLILKNCSDRKIAIELTQLSEQNVIKLKDLSKNIEAEQVIYIIERLSFYSKEIKETTNRYLWLELCIIELSSNVKYSSYAELISRIEAIEAGSVLSSAIKKAPPSLSPVPVLPQKENFITENKAKTEDKQTSILKTKQEINETVIEEPNPEHSVEEKTSPNITNNESTDLSTAWQGILQNIESMPSRMFFYNLSRPVSLTKDQIIISFSKEIFVKQAKEGTKNLPLKKAATAYFNVDDINIQINLSTEEDAPPKPVLNLEKKKELTTSSTLEPIERELMEESAELLREKNSTTNNTDTKFSDQTRMIVELFNGKIIE